MGVVRLTGGHARGRTLTVKELPGLRPTSGRVREALFSVIGQDLAGERVLDAFGGSGLLGFEAWSRGADVTIVERSAPAVAALRAAAAGLSASVHVEAGDVLVRAAAFSPFDVVLADPPYAADVAPILAALAPRARRVLVLEAAATTAVPEVAGALRRDRVRPFGGTALHVFWATA